MAASTIGRSTKAPESQNSNCCNCASLVVRITSTTEWPSPAMVTPISTMRIGDSPPALAAMAKTRRLVSSAPRAAAVDRPSSEPVPNTVLASTTASEAPALSPSVSGEAMRLRDRVCTSTPAMPSPAPTMGAITARGSRRLAITTAVSEPSKANSACQTCPRS